MLRKPHLRANLFEEYDIILPLANPSLHLFLLRFIAKENSIFLSNPVFKEIMIDSAYGNINKPSGQTDIINGDFDGQPAILVYFPHADKLMLDKCMAYLHDSIKLETVAA